MNYGNGKVNETQILRLNFSYIESENLLCNSDGHMDDYYDYVYGIKDGEMTVLYSGWYGWTQENRGQFDEYGNCLYKYIWEGKVVDQMEYDKQLNAVYDQRKAIKETECEQLTKEELLKAINEIR